MKPLQEENKVLKVGCLMTPLFCSFLLPRNTSQNSVYNMPNTTSTINSSNKFSLFLTERLLRFIFQYSLSTI